ncbi:MAG: CsbD family protein [Actinomycetota bacterium]|nr:CsbD family protein [Acidimicrobiia bacterium]MDQ3294835.1 CsbD family protein [Actinomycetota bacterium]
MGIDDVKGRVKEAVGDATDNKDLEREGKTDQAADKVKGAVNDVKDKVENVVNPDK